jgi:hypothetical protein
LKESKKTERRLDNVLGMLAELGVNVDASTVKERVKAYVPPPSDALEGVLASIHRPGDYLYRCCKRESCKQPFGSNYRAVAYCSDRCRISDFESTTGIKWSNKSPEERWGGEPPLVIPPDVIFKMLRYARLLVHEADKQGWEIPEDIPVPLRASSPAQSAVSVEKQVSDPLPTENHLEANPPLLQRASKRLDLST